MKTSNYHHFPLIFLLFIVILSCGNREKKPYATSPDIYLPDTDFKVVGYLSGGSFDVIDDLELEKLTYLNLAFGNPDKDGKIVVKYIGEDSTIDELILFGNMNNTGFAVIRVLGNKMDPAKIMKLGDVVQSMTSEENSVNDFMKFFNVEAPKELQLPPETIEIIED